MHGLENKFLHLDFFKYVEQFEIFILLETHVEEKNIIKFNNKFKNFDLLWNPATRNSKHGRGIGGYVCGVRKNLVDIKVKHVYKAYGNIDVIMIKTDSTECNIIPLYLREANWEAEFKILQQFMLTNDISNPIFIGDVNVRIGEEQQVLDCNIISSFTAGIEQRKSNDKKQIRGNGRKLLELYNNFGLVVLNGRTLGDEEGRFTFSNNNGSSVIDICAVSIEMLSLVESFTVDDHIWSDHFPIKLILSVDIQPNTSKKNELIPKLKWNPKNSENYKVRLDNNLMSLQEAKEFVDVNDLKNLVLQSHTLPNKNHKQTEYKNKWYDKECEKAREKSMEALKAYRKSQSISDKEIYSQSRYFYHNVLKAKRKKYYENVEESLNDITDSKRWWALAREIRQQENNIGNNINVERFREYFKTLLNPSVQCSELSYALNLVIDYHLDKPFSLREIKTQLSKVKANKAPGEDRIPYEFYINASDNFLESLAKAFTDILNGKECLEIFSKSIICPIHKKGDINDPSNYRGISFMNSIGKIMIGIVNERIVDWSKRYRILNEYQAGFRRGYSTVDNIFCLTSIVNLKFAEKRKVYAFFVDFKAAFDRVPRRLLFYKLHQMGMSTKIVNFIEKIYQKTQSAVWSGTELSEYFETQTGVKQGCLLSPMLFALYLNDLHDHLGGGLYVNGVNIRVLMYADDIVMLAEDIESLQKMINNLEEYCQLWGMEVNLAKSEIMIFQKAGRNSLKEKWRFNGEDVKIVSEYRYLGILLTPAMTFSKHVADKTSAAKSSLNSTWKNFIGRREVSLKAKWKMFLAVCRAIQSYGSQVWGNSHFEEIDKFQRFFTKRILKLPDNTPNYVIALETGQEEGHFYTYSLHLKYTSKTLFDYEEERLPQILAKQVIAKNIYWYKEFKNKLLQHNISSDGIVQNKAKWNEACLTLLEKMKFRIYEEHLTNAHMSRQRVYKSLDHSRGITYCNQSYNQEQITYIMKARGDLLWLNGNQFRVGNAILCSLCNLREPETTIHFLGICPVLNAIRVKYFQRPTLTENEVLHVLDGGEDAYWLNLYNFVKEALKYRNMLIAEFNF